MRCASVMIVALILEHGEETSNALCEGFTVSCASVRTDTDGGGVVGVFEWHIVDAVAQISQG